MNMLKHPEVLTELMTDPGFATAIYAKPQLPDKAALDAYEASMPDGVAGYMGVAGLSVDRWDKVGEELRFVGRMQCRPGDSTRLLAARATVSLCLYNAILGDNQPLTGRIIGDLLGLPENETDREPRRAVSTTLREMSRAVNGGLLQSRGRGWYQVREGYAIRPLVSFMDNLPLTPVE